MYQQQEPKPFFNLPTFNLGLQQSVQPVSHNCQESEDLVESAKSAANTMKRRANLGQHLGINSFESEFQT